MRFHCKNSSWFHQNLLASSGIGGAAVDNLNSRPGPTKISRLPIDGVAAVQVSGELDLATVEILEASAERALTHSIEPLLIDFTDCGFIDSSVLSLLVKLRNRLGHSSPPRFAVVARDQPLRVLHLTRLVDEMAVFASLEEAINGLQVAGAVESSASVVRRSTEPPPDVAKRTRASDTPTRA